LISATGHGARDRTHTCGKTTTLYAALNHVNSPDTKVITAEDPVEYRLGASIRFTSQSEDRFDVRDDPEPAP
jgi:Tfp pilus assembly pilus retraction ATPase PilT